MTLLADSNGFASFSAFTDWIRTPAGNALPAPAGSVSGVEEAE